MLCLFADKYNDSFHHQHRQRNGRYNSGSWRGRTFYGRRAQQPMSETATFNTSCQKTLTRDFFEDSENSDGSWHDRQINGRSYVDKNMCLPNNWQEQNGYRKGCSTRGSSSDAYTSFRQRAKSSIADLDDFDDDPWPPASTESASRCSNSSMTSTVAPLSPEACSGWCLFQLCTVY